MGKRNRLSQRFDGNLMSTFHYFCCRTENITDSALQFLADAEKEHHKRIVANIVRQIQPRINDLHDLLMNPPPVSSIRVLVPFHSVHVLCNFLFLSICFFYLQKNDIKTTITVLSPPFGNTRLYVVSLFSVLLETGNPDIIKL